MTEFPEYSYAEVHEAMRKVAIAFTGHSIPGYTAASRAAAMLDAPQTIGRPQTTRDYARQEKLGRQAKRALDELAAAGKLIKVGRDERHPDGKRQATASYYTPTGWERAVRKAEERQELAAQTRRRWDAVAAALRATVPDVDQDERTGAVSIGLDGWERLLGLARTEVAGDAR